MKCLFFSEPTGRRKKRGSEWWIESPFRAISIRSYRLVAQMLKNAIPNSDSELLISVAEKVICNFSIHHSGRNNPKVTCAKSGFRVTSMARKSPGVRPSGGVTWCKCQWHETTRCNDPRFLLTELVVFQNGLMFLPPKKNTSTIFQRPAELAKIQLQGATA